MDVDSFLRQSAVLVVAGKGGVGKTTTTAALAQLAARAGLSVLVVDLEGKSGLPAAFGCSDSLEYEEVVLFTTSQHQADQRTAPAGAGRDTDTRSTDPDGETPIPPGTVRARRITPDDALMEYLAEHGLRRISKRLVSSGALDVVATAIPGIRDILVLGKVKQLERARVADLILVDAPATGHAMTFLSSARGLLDAARSGPVRSQAAEVVELLADPARCQVLLVTLPEEMPVNEVIEAAFALEDRIGVGLGPVVVNGCLPDRPELDSRPADAAAEVGITLNDDQARALAGAAAFSRGRWSLQQRQLARLADELPLAQLRLPLLGGDTVGPAELDMLAGALAEAIEGLPTPGDDPTGAATPAPHTPAPHTPAPDTPATHTPAQHTPAGTVHNDSDDGAGPVGNPDDVTGTVGNPVDR